MAERYPHILVLKEKHGDEYYIINTAEEGLRVRLAVLRERSESGHYYPTFEDVQHEYKRDVKEITKKAMGDFYALSDEDVSALPAKLKEAYDARKADLETRLAKLEAAYANDFWFPKLLEKVLALPEEEAIALKEVRKHLGCREYVYNAVNSLWNARSDAEYEGAEIEYAQPIP